MTTTERQDAPGRVIPILEQEFDDFSTEAGEFMAGKREEAQFIGFRLKQGVYGQRQTDRQMIRVKLPMGAVTPDQLDAFGEFAERFTPLKKGHITTRQNFQFHHVQLSDATEILRLLGDAGLSSREACGNVVRNVTTDPWAGVRDDEPFDVTPYAGAFVRYWVRNEITQLLPRKFKVTFSGSDEDRALTDIHDIGFIPEMREIDGKPVKGFRMLTGGGLSIMAKKAVLLREWVSVDEYLKVSEAVLRIFNEADELRKNIAKARIKFLVHRVGEEEFQRMVDEKLAEPWAQRDIKPDDLIFIDDEEADAPPPPSDPEQPTDSDRAAFEEWKRTAVVEQRQRGYSTIEAKVPQGDISGEQFHALADILRTYGNGRARTAQWQNFVLRWIPNDSVYAVWKRLLEIGFGGSGTLEIQDVVSCPGTDSCKLGITSSMGLNRAITDLVDDLNVTDPLTRKVLINISGCPNSCGMHHLGNIGFHGAAIKSGERQVPAYHIFVAGERRTGRDLRLATQLKGRIPAKRAPDVVERFLKLYEADRNDGEEFNAFFDRVGGDPFTASIQDLLLPPEFSVATMQDFIDWERDGLYVLERGEGECAV